MPKPQPPVSSYSAPKLWARVALALAFELTLVVPASPARAEDAAADSGPDGLKRAREQFERALALQTAGDWAGALALLNEVIAIKSTPQVRFNIALCEEMLGRVVAALGHYELAARDARDENSDSVASEAEARLESLRQRIPKITVSRGSGAEAASIMLDGVSLGDQVIGRPMPTDPGPHVLEAKAPGYRPFRRSFRVSEQQLISVEIALEPEPTLAKPTAGPVRGPEQGGQGTRVAGYVVGGLGIATLGASGVFFALRQSKISELDAACPRRSCPADKQTDLDAGKRDTVIANVTLAVGAAALAGGLVLILTSDSGGQSQVAVAPAWGGAHVFGRF